MKVLALDDKGLGLGTSGLGLDLGLIKTKSFPQDTGHVVAVHLCSADTHDVT